MTGSATVVRGDALNLDIPDASVDLIVTSPPYFGLRSYQDNGEHYSGQIGSEPTPAEFVDALIAATREMVRVLKPSGSIWVNLGDKYSQRTALRRSSHQDGLQPDRPDLAKDWKASRAAGEARMPRENITDLSTGNYAPEKSLIGVPWRYALRCIDELGLILRAEVIWSKPNGLPESVTDRVRRSHETWFHFVVRPRYYSAVDEVREEHAPQSIARTGRNRFAPDLSQDGVGSPNTLDPTQACNPLGKLPGSVWVVPTQPLKVPAHLGIDHFAAFPMEWPRRIIRGWSPAEVCSACGEGRRPARDGAWVYSEPGNQNAATALRKAVALGITADNIGSRGKKSLGDDNRSDGQASYTAHAHDLGLQLGGILYANQLMSLVKRQITGYACACPDTSAPSTPGVVLDPFGGTGTTALVAKALGRHGISNDLSADYCRLAEWRTNDPGELARAMQVEKPDAVHIDQLDLFGESA